MKQIGRIVVGRTLVDGTPFIMRHFFIGRAERD